MAMLVFVVYDILVQRRQELVMRTATNANAVVSSLFPSSIQQRMLQDAEEQRALRKGNSGKGDKADLKNFLEESRSALKPFESKPIVSSERSILFRRKSC